MKLAGKTAIVTGAGSGIGKAIAVLFAKEGAKVVLTDIDQQSLNDTTAQIKAEGGQAIAVAANIAKQEDIDIMVDSAVNNFGSLDILVNNAGIMDNFKTVGECTDELWDRVLAVNLTGPFKASRAAIKVMEKQENGGVVINNASVGGLFGSPGGAAYVTAKHGLVGLTKNMAATYGLYGKIRVNTIAPGAVATRIGTTITEPSEIGYKALMDRGPAPTGDSMQIAEVALFLASDASSFVNGAIITADGGWTVR